MVRARMESCASLSQQLHMLSVPARRRTPHHQHRAEWGAVLLAGTKPAWSRPRNNSSARESTGRCRTGRSPCLHAGSQDCTYCRPPVVGHQDTQAGLPLRATQHKRTKGRLACKQCQPGPQRCKAQRPSSSDRNTPRHFSVAPARAFFAATCTQRVAPATRQSWQHGLVGLWYGTKGSAVL